MLAVIITLLVCIMISIVIVKCHRNFKELKCQRKGGTKTPKDNQKPTETLKGSQTNIVEQPPTERASLSENATDRAMI